MIHDLDAATATGLIRKQFPHLEAAPAEFLGEGWDYRAFRAVAASGESWVFRFPKAREGEIALEREIAVLARLIPQCPLPIPHYELRGTASAPFPMAFGGYPYLPGRPLGDLPSERFDLQRLGAQLGPFLAHLHAAEPGPVEASLPRANTLAAAQTAALEDLAATEDLLTAELTSRCRAFLQRPPPEYRGAARLLHNDLGDEHILADPEIGGVTGIIDWSNVALGDPAIDFAGLWLYGDDALLGAALAGYPLLVDEGFAERVRFRGVGFGVAGLFYGREMDEPGYITWSRAALERIFEKNTETR